jgi:hypothetical protein
VLARKHGEDFPNIIGSSNTHTPSILLHEDKKTIIVPRNVHPYGIIFIPIPSNTNSLEIAITVPFVES